MTREVSLSRGLVALVDDADFERVTSIGKWYADPSSKTYYARRNYWRNGRCMSLRMHHVVSGLSYVDHANGNGLDNRRANLRPATDSQNAMNRGLRSDNRSGFKGVSWSRARDRWVVEIQEHGVSHHLGIFTDLIEAAHAYDAAALTYFGEFARLNFPEGIAS